MAAGGTDDGRSNANVRRVSGRARERAGGHRRVGGMAPVDRTNQKTDWTCVQGSIQTQLRQAVDDDVLKAGFEGARIAALTDGRSGKLSVSRSEGRPDQPRGRG